MMIPSLNDVFTNMELFSVLVGALAHDVGHPGVNNVYLVKSKHELALSHNDKSPLENMHCVVLYEILGKAATNIFVNLSEAQWRESRKIILTIILGTDMSHHFEQISKTQLFLEVNGEDVKEYCVGLKPDIDCMKDEKNRMFIMELVLHCSDISNPFKPYTLCAKWADLVVEEFCLQGDRERSEGLEISPMCDRDQIVLCNMQMGFIEFVVAPLIIAFVQLFPPLHELGNNMLNNFQSWGERRKMEILDDEATPGLDKPEECRKMDERLGKFNARMAFVNQLRELPRRKRLSMHSTGI
jgi:cAMP-specific phosphodiesterase 4